MADFPRILEAIEKGEPQAAEALLPLVYDELRKLARQKLRHEQPGQTLEATALVHEAYLRLVGNREQGTGNREKGNTWVGQTVSSVSCPLSPRFEGRGHFFAAAAEAM